MARLVRFGNSSNGSGWDSMTGYWAKDKDAYGDYILEGDAWFSITAASPGLAGFVFYNPPRSDSFQ